MKKLVYFSHGLSANGIETFLVNVFRKIDKSKYDITVIIAIDDGVESLHEEKVLKMGIKVLHAGDLGSPGRMLAYVKNVKRFLKDESYDIAHSNMDLLNGITLYLAKKAGIPVKICHAHTSRSQYKPVGRGARIKATAQKIYTKMMKKSILSSSDVLLACSDVAAEYFYGNKKYRLIYNGIDMNSFRLADNDVESFAESLGFRCEYRHRIVSVGRISTHKNSIFALEIISELKKLRNDFNYIWIGAGELEKEAKEKSTELEIDDIVLFPGVRTDVARILNCCDCFLMPSLFEGLPFSLIEAQAAGLRCIVSDVVTKTADIGMIKYYSLNKSAKEWASFINSQLDMPMPEIIEEKSKLFDIDNTVRQLEEIYDD